MNLRRGKRENRNGDGEIRGVLARSGGNLHDYGKQIVLQDVSRKETVAILDAKATLKDILSRACETVCPDGGYKFCEPRCTKNFPQRMTIQRGSCCATEQWHRGWILPPSMMAKMAALRRIETAHDNGWDVARALRRK